MSTLEYLIALISINFLYVSAQSGSGGCTMHMYSSQDKVNGACGKYFPLAPSSVNGGFITAWKDLPAENVAGCGVCLKVTSTKTSKSTTVVVVDRGGAMGLDLSQSAIQAIDPDWAVAGNTPCQWEVTSTSNCQGAA
uniref:Barwin domain-containing protein n=1 Tax=Spongospora subterranea TaxID=70186 RepID=A0A0H5QGM8_9EUKA|eukprot:CRZ00757.1 hypothetical protein [Spongospora subterranea]